MKIEGFVNKYNSGIAKVKLEMAANGNPPPAFDFNKLTEFLVTVLVSNKVKLGTSNGTINASEPINEPINEPIESLILDVTVQKVMEPRMNTNRHE